MRLAYDWVAPLKNFRYPAKYFLMADLAFCVLAFRSLQDLSEGQGFTALRRGTLASIVVLIGVAFSSLLAFEPSSFFHPIGILLLTAGIAWFRPRWTGGLAALLLLDLLLVAPSQVDFGRSYSDAPAPAGQAAFRGYEKSVYCYANDLVVFDLPLEGRPLSESYHLGAQALGLPTLNACNDLVAGTPYSILVTTAQQEYKGGVDVGNAGAIRALGCTHFVTWRKPGPIAEERLGMPDIYERALKSLSGPKPEVPAIYRIVDPVPAAFIARNPVRLSNVMELLPAIDRSRNSAEVVRWVETRTSDNAPLPAGMDASEPKVEWHGDARATITVSGKGGAIVGLRTRHAQGWTAHQGGHELPIVRVAGVMLGAWSDEVSAGPIELRYFPPRLWESLVASLLAILLIAVLVGLKTPRPSGAA
jgi:hypothetical protein